VSITSTVPSRRDRLRESTKAEILGTARALLVSDGLPGVTLRAISREIGMTAPALYRYYPSLDSLLEQLCVTLFDECTGHITAASAGSSDAGSPQAGGPEAGSPGAGSLDIGVRLGAACRAFREWSRQHPAEFTMMFSSPSAAVGGLPTADAADAPIYAAGMRFCAVYLRLFEELWKAAPFPVPADDELPPDLRDQLATFQGQSGTLLPVGGLQVYLSCWIRLYGMVALEVFGHLRFALTDGEPMFETELAACADQLGITIPQ
jgi:AcrR family transcriptional regulator